MNICYWSIPVSLHYGIYTCTCTCRPSRDLCSCLSCWTCCWRDDENTQKTGYEILLPCILHVILILMSPPTHYITIQWCQSYTACQYSTLCAPKIIQPSIWEITISEVASAIYWTCISKRNKKFDYLSTFDEYSGNSVFIMRTGNFVCYIFWYISRSIP